MADTMISTDVLISHDPVGHAQVQAIPRQVRQSDGLAAEGVSAQAWPVRPLAAHRVHL